MSEKNFLEFVCCPNSVHIEQEGWKSRQIYYVGNGMFQCNSCEEEFTLKQIRDEIVKDYQLRLRNLAQDHQLNLVRLYKQQKDVLDKFDAMDF